MAMRFSTCATRCRAGVDAPLTDFWNLSGQGGRAVFCDAGIILTMLIALLKSGPVIPGIGNGW